MEGKKQVTAGGYGKRNAEGTQMVARCNHDHSFPDMTAVGQPTEGTPQLNSGFKC